MLLVVVEGVVAAETVDLRRGVEAMVAVDEVRCRGSRVKAELGAGDVMPLAASCRAKGCRSAACALILSRDVRRCDTMSSRHLPSVRIIDEAF